MKHAVHTWTFFRVGGFDQVRLDSGADIAALRQLDQKLWTALACPIHGLEFDDKTLAMIDIDHDGRIRPPEIIAAAEWATSHLKDPDALLQGPVALPLASINDAGEEGRQLLASAKEILTRLGKGESDVITLDDTADTEKIFAQTRFNGDGVVPPESAHDERDAHVIRDVIACLGAEIDRSGKPGIDQQGLDRFFAAVQHYADWWQAAEVDAANVLPFGADTSTAYEALAALRPHVDDYFARCRLAAYDPRAAPALNRSYKEYAALADRTLSADGHEFADFPLAHVEPERPLPLTQGYNPAWTREMTRLRTHAVEPMFGQDKTGLSDAEWQALKSRFAAHEAWRAKKAGGEVEKLGLVRVRELLADDARARISALIAEDKALEPEMNAIVAVERLIRYHRDLYTLLNNFVNFRDFYSRVKKSVFQVGTLYLDGRACDLCVRVADPAKHGVLASFSSAYLAYLDCTRRGSTEKMSIVAAITDGDADHLMVGRNAVFYDRKGADWDATIVKIVENPISIRQAVWAPYKRMGRMIGEQIEKMAAAKDKAVSSRAAAAVESTAAHAEAGKPAAPAPFDVAKFAGIFAAIGLAIGALGTALAAMVTGLLSLAWWQIPLAILGIMLVISGPSVVLAWLKLRRRNLAPILDANGWAVNARVKINIPFGRSLTQLAALPPGTRRTLADPYAEKNSGKWIWLALLIAALAVGGYYYYAQHRASEHQAARAAETVTTLGLRTQHAQGLFERSQAHVHLALRIFQ